jgi:hypothetical protein
MSYSTGFVPQWPAAGGAYVLTSMDAMIGPAARATLHEIEHVMRTSDAQQQCDEIQRVMRQSDAQQQYDKIQQVIRQSDAQPKYDEIERLINAGAQGHLDDVYAVLKQTTLHGLHDLNSVIQAVTQPALGRLDEYAAGMLAGFLQPVPSPAAGVAGMTISDAPVWLSDAGTRPFVEPSPTSTKHDLRETLGFLLMLWMLIGILWAALPAEQRQRYRGDFDDFMEWGAVASTLYAAYVALGRRDD